MFKLDKDELSAKLNEMLDLKEPVNFTKLSKEELDRLFGAVEVLSMGGGILGNKLLNQPLGKIMDMRLKDVFLQVREGKGPVMTALQNLRSSIAVEKKSE